MTDMHRTNRKHFKMEFIVLCKLFLSYDGNCIGWHCTARMSLFFFLHPFEFIVCVWGGGGGGGGARGRGEGQGERGGGKAYDSLFSTICQPCVIWPVNLPMHFLMLCY